MALHAPTHVKAKKWWHFGEKEECEKARELVETRPQ